VFGVRAEKMASDMEVMEAESLARGKLRIVAIMTALSVRKSPKFLVIGPCFL
jgi:hypothetical protein